MERVYAIVFDLGGILVFEGEYSIENEVAKILDDNPQTLKNYFELNKQLTIGRIGLREYYLEIVSGLGKKENSKNLFDFHMNLYAEKCTEVDSKIFDLIALLRKNYQVIALTNTQREIADFNRRRGLFDYFDRTFISCDMGLMKPDKKIYVEMLKELKIDARNTFFIDDKGENVEAAREVGMNAVRYTNYDNLVRDLKRLGLYQINQKT